MSNLTDSIDIAVEASLFNNIKNKFFNKSSANPQSSTRVDTRSQPSATNTKKGYKCDEDGVFSDNEIEGWYDYFLSGRGKSKYNKYVSDITKAAENIADGFKNCITTEYRMMMLRDIDRKVFAIGFIFSGVNMNARGIEYDIDEATRIFNEYRHVAESLSLSLAKSTKLVYLGTEWNGDNNGGECEIVMCKNSKVQTDLRNGCTTRQNTQEGLILLMDYMESMRTMLMNIGGGKYYE